MIAGLFAVAPAAAQQHADCAAEHSTLAMRACYARATATADAELNRTYRALVASLDAGRRVKLLTAQRAWLRYRDSHCAFMASESEGGTLEAVQRAACVVETTRARTRELRTALPAR
ncbi:MAG TPA: lysozyme inhibitor LprI family protein [Longimicrobiaceae bacterium]|nr:lysozyme inhibitor LprI family protein [Longimicrobiaceae bacterium]